MKKIITTLIIGAALGAASPAFANSHEEGEAAHVMTTSNTTIDALMADEAALAVLNEHIPEIVNNPQISMAAGMTLHDIQMYAPDQLTNEKLAEIDAGLAPLAH